MCELCHVMCQDLLSLHIKILGKRRSSPPIVFFSALFNFLLGAVIRVGKIASLLLHRFFFPTLLSILLPFCTRRRVCFPHFIDKMGEQNNYSTRIVPFGRNFSSFNSSKMFTTVMSTYETRVSILKGVACKCNNNDRLLAHFTRVRHTCIYYRHVPK